MRLSFRILEILYLILGVALVSVILSQDHVAKGHKTTEHKIEINTTKLNIQFTILKQSCNKVQTVHRCSPATISNTLLMVTLQLIQSITAIWLYEIKLSCSFRLFSIFCCLVLCHLGIHVVFYVKFNFWYQHGTRVTFKKIPLLIQQPETVLSQMINSVTTMQFLDS